MYRIAIDLLSGTASDLIDLSGLDINHKAQGGLLVNLYDFMDNDPDFDKSDYYTNIFEAMEYEGGLYSMPLSFNYDMVYISKPLAESIGLDYENYKTINYTEMLDIYEKVKKTHPSPDKFYLMPGVTKNSFFNYESVGFYDIETGDANFNSEEFIQHLMLTKKLNTVYHPDTPTISSYLDIFNNPKYLKAYLNSVIIVVPILIGQCIISPLAAYAFEYSKWKYKEILFFFYILIMLMPLQVLLVTNYLIADWLGLVDNHLSIILPGIFNPIGVFIIRLQLKGFPKECIEAAQNSGASHFQVFKYIVLPNIKPAIAILIMLIFTEYWNVIEQGIVLLKTSSLEPLSIYLSQIADKNLGMFFATSCLYLIPIFLIFFFTSKAILGDRI